MIRARTLLAVGFIATGIVLALSPSFTNQGESPYHVDVDVYSQEIDMPYRVIEDEPVVLEFKEIEGSILSIPSLEITYEIGYGIEKYDIDKGPSFYPQSQHPLVGNVAIAGHRTTYGAPFRHLDQLVEGDQLVLLYDDIVYHYIVENVFTVNNRDWSVIYEEDNMITLTTCHPPGWATQRLVVQGRLLGR